MCSWRRLCSLILPVSLLINSGCNESGNQAATAPGDDHGHDHGHDHNHGPATLKEAIAQLTALRDTMKDAFAKNDMDAAHDPLHEVGHVLEAIPELAAKENVNPANLELIKTSVNTLMDAFGAVDKTMHGQEGSTYGEESNRIDTTLAGLTVLCEGGSLPGSTEAPTVEAPTVEAPTTEAPATEAPAAEPPATEAPSAETTPEAQDAPK